MRATPVVQEAEHCPDPQTLYPDPDGKIRRQVQDILGMSVKELQAKHVELYGFPTRSKHKRQLQKRLAWRVQELAWGGLSERAQQRLAEIEAQISDADARFLPPRKSKVVPMPKRRSDGLTPGTALEREYGGEVHRVTILPEGVEYQGRTFRSLSAVAREITGTRWNGRRWFGLVDHKGARR